MKFTLKLNYSNASPRYIGDMSFENNNIINEYNYCIVMDELTKKSWTDFDYHRYYIRDSLDKIKNVHWIEVDDEVYNKILKYKPGLESSRYGHYSFKKCYPSPEDCHECFKYWCSSCGKGSNSMYHCCTSKKCITFFEKIPEVFVINTQKKRIQVFKYSSDFRHLLGEKRTIRNKDTYNFEEVKNKVVESKNLHKRIG